VPRLTPLDVTPRLQPERASLLTLLGRMSPSDWERPTECPAWNVKGIALHILGDDLSLLTRQRDASTNSLLLYAQDHPGLGVRDLLDGFNEQWVTAASFLSSKLVIELLRLVGEWSDTFYCEVGLQTVSQEPVGFFATDQPSPYWQVIAREYVERVVHQSQIRRAVGAPEIDAELLTTAARVVVYSLAAWMREHAPPTGSMIGIDLGPAGAFTWRREPDHWSVDDGADRSTNALLTVAPERGARFVSRGLTRRGVEDALTVSGDGTLARGALETIVPLVGT
jgi:hypothetical protein